MPILHDNKYEISRPRNRDRFYLTYVFLKIIEAKEDDEIGASKTHLMYKSFSSHTEVRSYLNHLMNNDLISLQQKGNRQIYSLTEKGTKCINIMDKFIELIPHQFAKDFENVS